MMRRVRYLTASLALLTLSGCRDSPFEASAFVSVAYAQSLDAGSGPRPTPVEIRRAVHALASPEQATRDTAAARLRSMHERDPTIGSDPTAWRRRLAAIRPGMREAEFRRMTSATPEGSGSGGGGTSAAYRLDDYWVVNLALDDNDRIRRVGALERVLRHVWVEPSQGFSGPWKTYFVSGALSHDIEYTNGRYARFTDYYDNGQRAYEQRYVSAGIDGPEIGFDREGRRIYEIHHSMGQSVGRWVHWYSNGQMQSEETYVANQREGVSTNWRENGTRSTEFRYLHGQETGQAAWDERGVLLYAHGTSETAVRDR